MSDTQYLIDIAAEMSGGDDAIAKLTAMADRLVGAGESAPALTRALAQAEQAMGQAGAAAQAAAADLSTGEAKYSELERAANRAAKAVERAAARKGAIPPDLQAKADAASAALKKHATVVDSLRSKADAAAAAEARLGKSISGLKGAVQRAQGRQEAFRKSTHGTGLELGELSETFGRIGGPMGAFGQRATDAADSLSKMRRALGSSGGLVALVGLLTVALIAGAVAIGAYAIKLADSRRETALTTAAYAAHYSGLRNLATILPGVSAATGVHVDELRGLAKQLHEAKVSADDMPKALRAVAMAEAALGKGGSAEFIAQLKEGKTSVAKLAKEVDGKFGKIVAKRLLGLEGQGKRLKSLVGKMFGELNIEPFLKGLQKMVDLFDESTAMGKTMKWAFESLFQGLIDKAAGAFVFIERFFLGIAIGALKAFVALKPAIRAVQKFLGVKVDSSLSLSLQNVQDAGEAAGKVLIVVAGLVAAAFWLARKPFQAGVKAIGALKSAAEKIPGAFSRAWAAITGGASKAWKAVKGAVDDAWTAITSITWEDVGAAIVNAFFAPINFIIALPGHARSAYTAISSATGSLLSTLVGLWGSLTGAVSGVMSGVTSSISAAWRWIKNFSFASAGKAIIDGLVAGIKAAGGAVLTALTGIVSGAVKAVKKQLGIKSPSRVFAAIGEQTAEGMEQGVEGRSKSVQSSLESMVAPPKMPPKGAGAKAAPGGPSIDLSGVTFVFNGVPNAEAAEASIRELLTQIIEGDVMQLGAAEVAPA